MGVANSIPAVSPQHLRYLSSVCSLCLEGQGPGIAVLLQLFQLHFLSFWQCEKTDSPKMGETSSSQKLCISDEESQLTSHNCVLGKTGNKATASPYSGSHKSQTSFFPHSSQSLDLEGKSIHPINKVC